MSDVYLTTQSQMLTKALQANSLSSAFTIPQSLAIAPTADGVFDAGSGGRMCSNRIWLQPFCDAAPGANFLMRLFGWREVMPNADPNKNVWFATPIIEIACWACNVNGLPPQGGYLPRYITDSERMCDAIVLNYGVLGFTGTISSSIYPGTDLVAFLTVELSGVRKFSFDFQQVDPNVAMNCLWSLL